MASESDLREFVRSLAGYAKSLRDYAAKEPDVKGIYNSLCDVLDALNEELKEERAGAFPPSWHKFPLL